MVADAALWALFAISIVFVWWGCYKTRRTPKAGMETDHSFSHAEFDRAA
jgi:hypothetical protein